MDSFRSVQLAVHIRPASHLQFFDNPLQRHTRFLPQPSRHRQFARVSLVAPGQIIGLPAQLVQFSSMMPRFFLRRLTARCRVMTFSRTRVRLVQKFLTKKFTAQAPATPDEG